MSVSTDLTAKISNLNRNVASPAPSQDEKWNEDFVNSASLNPSTSTVSLQDVKLITAPNSVYESMQSHNAV